MTSTLRLGTMVSPATFRHPSELAKLVTTADHVSGGRVELGLGAGWHEREHEAYGFPFADTRTRMDVLEEQLQIVLGTWTEAPFSFSGEHYTLKDLDAQPKPVQQPAPAADHGRLGRPAQRRAGRALRRRVQHAVRHARGRPRRARRPITSACEAAGRDPLPFCIMTGVVVGADEAELHDRATPPGRADRLRPPTL